MSNLVSSCSLSYSTGMQYTTVEKNSDLQKLCWNLSLCISLFLKFLLFALSLLYTKGCLYKAVSMWSINLQPLKLSGQRLTWGGFVIWFLLWLLFMDSKRNKMYRKSKALNCLSNNTLQIFRFLSINVNFWLSNCSLKEIENLLMNSIWTILMVKMDAFKSKCLSIITKLFKYIQRSIPIIVHRLFEQISNLQQ